MFAAPSSQMALVSGKVRRAALRCRPYGDAPASRFVIDGGIHDGCGAEFAQDRVIVGSGTDCDLVLVDPDIEDAHAEVSFAHSLLGAIVRVKALGGPVTVDGETLAKGASTGDLQLPVSVELAEQLTLRIGRRRGAAKPGRGRVERTLGRLKWLAVGLGITAAYFVAVDLSSGRQYSVISGDPALLPVITRAPRVTIDDFAGRLAAANLARSVTLRENADGLFQVSGHLTSDQWRDWQAVSEWYDAASYDRPLVNSITVGRKFRKLPPISMLRLSEPAQIILSNGDTLTVGDDFADGWKISGIAREFIEVSRGEEVEKISLAGVGR